MKTGLNLNELAARITQDRSTLKDYVGGTSHMRMDNAGHLILQNGSQLDFGVRRIAHEQIAEKVGIPQKYYDRMLAEAPALLALNVNEWFAKEPSVRLVRTIAGEARAFLGEGYRPLDNYDVAEHVIPRMVELGLEVVSSQITESRLYIQARDQRRTGEIVVGDAVQGGVVISNSEVGRGSLSISELIYRLVCKNGMVGGSVVRQAHVGGGRKGNITFAEESFKQSTRTLIDRAFWAQTRDAIDSVLSAERFDKRIEKMKRAAKVDIGAPDKAVEAIVEVLQLAKEEGSGILGHLARGGSMTQWGLANAVTAMAHDTDNYDRAFEFEQMGTKVVELPRSTFEYENN